jgi:putative DNA methylase
MDNSQAGSFPGVLIEKWFPLAEVGVESRRERAASSALPPLYFLHVWWARRPLVACRAAILGSILPQWQENWPRALNDKFPTEESYHAWFKRLLGIHGDPLQAQKIIQYAKTKGLKLPGNPYGYSRAFAYNPDADEVKTLLDLLEFAWGSRDIAVIDPMAGGGSIPFEALRCGLTTYAYELNPVASVILKGTIDFPARFGPKFVDEIAKWGGMLCKEVERRLDQYFPRQRGENIFAYIWARTVACPVTDKPVPLSPNWWLQKGNDPVAVQVLVDPEWPACRFRIVQGEKAIEAHPDTGTIRKGVAKSPWKGEPLDGVYIKKKAQSGRMGEQLYALRVKTSLGNKFRSPSPEDLEAVARAGLALKEKLPKWEALQLVPRENIPDGTKTREPINYGMSNWTDLFTPRQLLSICTYVEVFLELKSEWEKTLSPAQAEALETYLALAIDKSLDYNSRMVRWHSSRGVIAGTFDRHDFSFKWSHAEFDAAHNLFPWALDQIIDSYKGLTELASPVKLPLFRIDGRSPVDRLYIGQGNAADLSHLADSSIKIICVDPPYYANVMYAELSDYYYVWLKRTLGETYPEFFLSELTDKEDEAVANFGRFAALGKKKKDLAKDDYERKMAACFREFYRVLAPDGVLTVMFTHKEAEAWDTLATGLLAAGFVVQASWPVHTESEHSLHQVKKSAAASTILLVCRKRPKEKKGDSTWWDDLKGKVRQVAGEKAHEFQKAGIQGVDLYLSTYGPVLSVISQKWPVLTSELDPQTGKPRPLKPEEALNIARQEVFALRKQGLLLGRSIQFDPVTDWYLFAWDAFKAGEFPADEARKLALSLGLDLEDTIVQKKRLLTKKQNFVALNEPKARRKKGMVDPEAPSFPDLIDAVHTAMLLYQEDGAGAAQRFLQRSGLLYDDLFKNCLQALLNAIPRTRDGKGKFLRNEADLLEKMRLAFFPDLTIPVEPEPPAMPLKVKKLDFSEEFEEEEPGEEDED